MQIWSIVDQKKFIDFMHEQLKLEDDARRHKIRKTQCTKRRSTGEDVTKARQERIRKLSKKKFKWFYDRKESGDDDPIRPNSMMKDDDGGCGDDNDRSTSSALNYAGSSSEINQENTESTEVEIMAWLRDLDLGGGD